MTTPSLPIVHLFVLKVETCLSTKQKPCGAARSQMALVSLAGPRWSSYQESVCSRLGILWALLVSQVCLLVYSPWPIISVLFRLPQKWSFAAIRCLGSWLCRFLASQGNVTEIAVPEVMWYDLEYLAELFPCNRSDNEIQVCICNVCKQLLENSPGGCLKTVHAGNSQLVAIARGITNVCCHSCPAHHQEKERETKLRRSDGHSEIRPGGAVLLLVLRRPLGTEGLTSCGARNDARAAGWADTAAARCGIKLG